MIGIESIANEEKAVERFSWPTLDDYAADLRVSLGKRAREHVLAQYDVGHLWQAVLDSLSLPVGS